MATSKTKPAARKTGAAKTKAASTAAKPTVGGGMPKLPDLGRLMKGIKLPGIDLAAIAEMQRKDMEALAEANQLAYEGIKSLAERRNQMLMEALGQWQETLQAASGPDVLSKQAALARERVKKAIADMRALAEIEADTRRKAWKVVKDRFVQNQTELRKLLKPS